MEMEGGGVQRGGRSCASDHSIGNNTERKQGAEKGDVGLEDWTDRMVWLVVRFCAGRGALSCRSPPCLPCWIQPDPREFSGSRPELSAVELPSSSVSCAASPFVRGGTFCFSCHLFAPRPNLLSLVLSAAVACVLSVYAVVILRSREQACSRQLRLSRPTVLALDLPTTAPLAWAKLTWANSCRVDPNKKRAFAIVGYRGFRGLRALLDRLQGRE